MKTVEEYINILNEVNINVENNFPNWKMISDKGKFASLFSKCLPDSLTYEDICVLCFYLHNRPEIKTESVKKEDRIPVQNIESKNLLN